MLVVLGEEVRAVVVDVVEMITRVVLEEATSSGMGATVASTLAAPHSAIVLPLGQHPASVQ